MHYSGDAAGNSKDDESVSSAGPLRCAEESAMGNLLAPRPTPTDDVPGDSGAVSAGGASDAGA